MSNSNLVCHTNISPCSSNPRNHAIDTITIHCMAGDLSIESCGNIFANKDTQASSNYGIGSDGRIGMYVEEENRSWATSSRSNDHRAVTIEVANCGGSPDWPVTDAALESLIALCTDICQRNGIPKLLWQADPDLIGQIDQQNMTVHRWYAQKACPGDYLFNLHGKIAEEVNKRLGVETPDTPATVASDVPFLVRVTADVLNIRSGPGTNNSIVDVLAKKATYTIVDTANGTGASKWGKLKSGAGWISMDYTQRV